MSLLALAVLLVAARPVWAQQSADLGQMSIEQLADVQITSVSRRPEPLAKAPAAIFVITADDIRRSGAVNLPEALRMAPNLEVARMNGFAYTVTARGFNSPESSNKLLVLVDGRSVYSPLASSVFWENIDVPLADVARIEVVSGPGATLYGANAVNGVINIVTKSAAETQGGLLDASAGSTDDKVMARYGFSPWDGGAVKIFGQISRANSTAAATVTDTSQTAWESTQAGFRFDQALGADAMTLQGDVFANHTPQMGIEKGRGYDLSGHWSHAFESGSALDVQLYSDENSRILPGLAREQLDIYDIQVQHNTSLGWNDSFIWGGEYRHSKESFYSQSPFGFANPTTAIAISNLFAQDEFSVLDKVKVTLGLKVENSSFSNVDFLPDLRVAWQTSDTGLLWAAVSRAVRTPSKVDRELEDPGVLLPAPNFKSEKMEAIEIGYRGEPLPNLSFSASLYYNIYNDLRTDHYTLVSILPLQLRNAITGNTYGGEVWGKYALAPWWRLNFGGSWLQRNLHLKPGRNDLTQGQSIGQDPPYQAQIRSEMNLLDDWEFDAGLRAVGHVETHDSTTGMEAALVGAYLEADMRIGYRLTGDTQISLDGFNLLHQRHLEANDPSTYLPQYVPRSFLLNLRKSF